MAKPRPPRSYLFKHGEPATIFEGEEAIAQAEAQGWCDHPAKAAQRHSDDLKRERELFEQEQARLKAEAEAARDAEADANRAAKRAADAEVDAEAKEAAEEAASSKKPPRSGKASTGK